MSTAAAAPATEIVPEPPTEVAVPLLDLKAQYATLREEIEPVVREVIESQYFIGGPKVEELERAIATYCTARFAVGCANGSDAILLALQALDIGPGDFVICPSYTFFATGGAIHRLGAIPVFVDIDPVTYNICPESTAEAFRGHGGAIRAVVPVHLFGQAADLDALLPLAKEHGVPVVEDAAQAIGATDVHGARVGTRGAFGTFSFFPSKNLGGFGDGGVVTTNDAALADRFRRLRNHGMEPKYHHDEVGMNSRLDALQAAVLTVKLRHLEDWSAGRQRNAARYDRHFADAGARTSATPLATTTGTKCELPLRTPHPAPKGARHIYNQYVIRVPAPLRDAVREELSKRKIGTEIYYPVPLHLQKCFAGLSGAWGGEGRALPHSELAARETIALPIYSELTERQIDWVARSVIDALRGLAR